MTTKYIIDNLDGSLTNQVIYGGLSAETFSATTLYVDGSQITKPYKVYTALLTQSGGDSEININTFTGELTIGVTYRIDSSEQEGGDWTNVGAPNNNPGTYFVAIGTTPNSWGAGGQLTYNTGAPVVTVLENTIGNIWFTYADIGNYVVNSDGLFITNKTYIDFGGFYGGENWINIYGNTGGIELLGSNDSILTNTPIEIRVYN
jgi:hypothetical protein